MLHVTRSRWSRRVAALAPAVLIVAACSTAASPTPAAPTPTAPSVASSAPAASVAASVAAPSGGSASGNQVTAKESEFKIELGATSAAAGSVTFQINNAGTVVHEFVVMKTDLASDKLPIDSSEGVASEETPGVTAIDEIEDIAVGASPTLTVDLPAGHYVVICNLPAHYAAGMRADFTTN
jgi:uncharacterized cupredoxin-like copper-binding protein